MAWHGNQVLNNPIMRHEAYSLAFLLVVLPAVPAQGEPVPPTVQTRPATIVTPISGVVRDGAGGVVQRATVIARLISGAERQTTTDMEGRFSILPPAAGDVTLIVRVDGFEELRREITGTAGREALEIVLSPAGVTDEVTVTPTRSEQRMGDVPASISVISRDEIRRSPAVLPDDLLRTLPTFSLFRRSSSLSAHPTSQGVSLRGIGPSGVSRTLVLLDGVPFNDPFGGWVYWTRIPVEGAERIEIVDSASSSLYGTYAMGGVINIVTATPQRRNLEMKTQYGSMNSPKLDVRGSDVFGKVGVTFDASVFDTDGYEPVVEVNPAGQTERGPIDNKADVTYRNLGVKLDYSPNEHTQTFARIGVFREKRDNGKISTFEPFTEEANRSEVNSFSGGVKMRLADQSQLSGTIFSDVETFRSNFMAVVQGTPVPRSVGRMTLNQRVPTTSVGGMVEWSKTFAGQHYLTAGTDLRWTDGDSEEDALDPLTGTSVVLHRVAGGTQRNLGLFVQDVISATPDLMITLSARVDSWKNYDPHNTETTVPGGIVSDPDLPERDDTVASPRAGARYRVNNRVSVWGGYGGGFRAPTLNELYRSFRVGAILTQANPLLGPERLWGGDLGVSFLAANNLTVRSTYFDNRVKDPVSNVTIGTNLQQRQNLGRTRIWGIQTDAEYRFKSMWRVFGAYLYEQAKVTENETNPALVGNYLPQVPKHRGTAQVSYENPRIANVTFEVQAVGNQHDNDANDRTVPGLEEPGLPKYAIVSLGVSRALSPQVDAFLAAQNLFDQEYFVGTQPTLIGPPRLVSVGLRLRLQGR
jgi:outer membrane receptor protein involved in Fe transport